MSNKHSAQFKQRVVSEYLQGGTSLLQLARHYGLSSGGIHLWVQRYRYHGKRAFEDPPRPRRPYPAEFKRHVLETMQREGLSARQAVARFQLSSVGVIRAWQARYDGAGFDPLTRLRRRPRIMSKSPKPPKRSNRPTAAMTEEQRQIARQQEELEYLRAENAYLKKLDALMRAKNRATGKK